MFLALLTSIKPYCTEGLSNLQSCTLISEFITLFSGIMLVLDNYMHNEASRAGEPDDLTYQREIIGALILLSNFTVMAWPALQLVLLGGTSIFKMQPPVIAKLQCWRSLPNGFGKHEVSHKVEYCFKPPEVMQSDQKQADETAEVTADFTQADHMDPLFTTGQESDENLQPVPAVPSLQPAESIFESGRKWPTCSADSNSPNTQEDRINIGPLVPLQPAPNQQQPKSIYISNFGLECWAELEENEISTAHKGISAINIVDSGEVKASNGAKSSEDFWEVAASALSCIPIIDTGNQRGDMAKAQLVLEPSQSLKHTQIKDLNSTQSDEYIKLLQDLKVTSEKFKAGWMSKNLTIFTLRRASEYRAENGYGQEGW